MAHVPSSAHLDAVGGVVGMAGWALLSPVVQHELPENHISSSTRNLTKT